MYSKLLMLIIFGTISLGTRAEPLTFSSGPSRVSMLELYTSEGCSSCPPAEKFLNSLRQSPRLWKDFIPMAFHVDYWNYLGWRDRFSSAVFSDRQRQYARLGHMATIYTPGFFVDGREWRRRFSRGTPPLQRVDAGELSIRVKNRQISGEYVPVSQKKSLKVNVALLGMDLKTKIERGERAGTTTSHEFVVLGYAQQPLQGRVFNIDMPAPIVEARQHAIVVWLSQGSDPTPLQAVGGMLQPAE